MRVFATIAASGSLSAAARRLAMPLTNVSRHLAALESELKAQLIVRTTRSLTLSESGREYLETCRAVIDQLDAAEARLRGTAEAPRGELVVTAPVAFGRIHVLPVVTAFLRKFPAVSVRLLLVDRNVDLVEEGIDVAVRIGALADSQMHVRSAGAVQRIVCASPTYLKSRGWPGTPADLQAHDIVAFAGFEADGAWVFRKNKRLQRVRLSPRLVLNSADAAVEAAIAGIGVTRVLSYQAAAAIASGKLERVLIDHEGAAVPVSVLYHGGRQRQPKVQEFVGLAAATINARLAEAVGREVQRSRPPGRRPSM